MSIDKSALLVRIRTLQKELDGLVDMVLALEETQPVVQVMQKDSDDWLTAKQVCKHCKISSSTFYSWIKDGLLPAGVSFGPRSKRWKLSDIEALHLVKKNPESSERQERIRKRGRPSRVRKIGGLCYA